MSRRRTPGEIDAEHYAQVSAYARGETDVSPYGVVPNTDTCAECGGDGLTVHGGSSDPDSPDHYPPVEEPCPSCYGSGSRKYREGWDNAIAGRGVGPAVPDTGQAPARLRVAGRNLLDALEEAEVDESFNPPTVANLRHYMTALEALVKEDR